MTISQLRIAKSETRNMAEQGRVRVGEPPDWGMTNTTFFTAFVAIAAALAIAALILR